MGFALPRSPDGAFRTTNVVYREALNISDEFQAELDDDHIHYECDIGDTGEEENDVAMVDVRNRFDIQQCARCNEWAPINLEATRMCEMCEEQL